MVDYHLTQTERNNEFESWGVKGFDSKQEKVILPYGNV